MRCSNRRMRRQRRLHPVRLIAQGVKRFQKLRAIFRCMGRAVIGVTIYHPLAAFRGAAGGENEQDSQLC